VEDGGVGDSERTRLHEIVDALPDEDVSVARQLLELLAKGRAAPTAGGGRPARSGDVGLDGSGLEDDADDDDPPPSAETIAKLAQLNDDELLRLDDLLESDPAAAKAFWRERFGEELEDDGLTGI
jgi:hypothetical protein